MAKLNKAIDEVRANEARQLKEEGSEPLLKHARWCLLKRPPESQRQQMGRLAEASQIQSVYPQIFLRRPTKKLFRKCSNHALG